MLRTHSPMHKQARIIRGLAKRLDDVEQDREIDGRVDISRSVSEAAISDDTVGRTVYDYSTFDFVWDETDNQGWDFRVLRESPRTTS